MPTKSKSFSATLERIRSGVNFVIVRVPFDVRKTFGAGARPKVKGEINGFAFRTSLFPTREQGHFLLVNNKMQHGAHVAVGSRAKFRLELDTDQRVIAVPPEMKKVFAEARSLERWFAKLSYSIRKWLMDGITQPKSPEARVRRAEQVAELLMSAMEAERELPPLLRVAFARNPKAQTAWERMTSTQRRGQLLAVFYYRNPEARARRLDKAVEEAIRLAERAGERKDRNSR